MKTIYDFIQKEFEDSVPITGKIRDAAEDLMFFVKPSKRTSDEDICSFLMMCWSASYRTKKGTAKHEGNSLFSFGTVTVDNETRIQVNREMVRKIKRLCEALLENDG